MEGYDKLAGLLGENKDLGMFRLFSPLNAKILLQMQAEILDLQDQWKNQASIDFESGDPKGQKFAKYWKALDEVSDDGVGSWQKRIISTIKSKLREYYELQLLTAQVNSLAKPRAVDYEYLSQWLDIPIKGDGFLTGIEADAYKPDYKGDLVLLALQSPQPDRFAEFMSIKILPWYHRFVGERYHKPVSRGDMLETWHYQQHVLVVLGDLICMFLSSSVPTVSIFVLDFLNNTIPRLEVITGMSFIFSAIMTFIVQGRRAEVFAATTAFAAVQVVFLGGQNYTLSS